VKYECRTTEVENQSVVYWEAGDGAPLLLMHGTGPGASTLGYWNDVLEPLAEHFHVIAYDLIGFGRSARKVARPYFDSELWVRQAHHMTTLFEDSAVNVLGHSASASVALRLAATAGARVRKVMTTGALGAESIKVNVFTARGWTLPTNDEELKEALSILFYDSSFIDDAYARRRVMLSDKELAAYFQSMFEGDKQQYLDQLAVSPETLSRIECEVMLVHGREDKPATVEHSLRLAAGLAKADLVILSRCGHAVANERPKFVVDLARAFYL
jgi:2-hydroxymuconate-semialdehyde hydrolase